MGKRCRFLLVAMLATGALLGLPAVSQAAPATGYLQLDSDAADSIGGGGWYDLRSPAAFVDLDSVEAGGLIGTVHEGGEDWWLVFATGGGAFERGKTYRNATRSATPGVPGLTVSGHAGCNASTSEFTVTDLAFAPNGSVAEFAADFVQRCDGTTAALRGRFVASTLFPAPAQPALPGPAPGVRSGLVMQSDWNDLLGQGRAHRVVAPLGTISAADGGGLLTVIASSPGESWKLEFRSPAGSALREGTTYPAAVTRSRARADLAGLDATDGVRLCDGTGSFTVVALQHGLGTSTTSAEIRFELHCYRTDAALRGVIWINRATDPAEPPTPAPAPVLPPTAPTPTVPVPAHTAPGAWAPAAHVGRASLGTGLMAPSLAVNAWGAGLIGYVDESGPGRRQVRVSERQPGGTWSAPLPIAIEGTIGASAPLKVALADDGTAALAVNAVSLAGAGQYTITTVIYERPPDGAWTQLTTLPTSQARVLRFLADGTLTVAAVSSSQVVVSYLRRTAPEERYTLTVTSAFATNCLTGSDVAGRIAWLCDLAHGWIVAPRQGISAVDPAAISEGAPCAMDPDPTAGCTNAWFAYGTALQLRRADGIHSYRIWPDGSVTDALSGVERRVATIDPDLVRTGRVVHARVFPVGANGVLIALASVLPKPQPAYPPSTDTSVDALAILSVDGKSFDAPVQISESLREDGLEFTPELQADANGDLIVTWCDDTVTTLLFDTTPPTAMIDSAGPMLVHADEQFHATATDDFSGVATLAWSFGDGTVATGPEASHAYASAGSYRVTLTATDRAGLSTIATWTTKIDDPASRVRSARRRTRHRHRRSAPRARGGEARRVGGLHLRAARA